MALDFVDTRQCDPDTLAKLGHAVVAVKVKVDKQYAVATDDWLWEKDLTAELAKRIGPDVSCGAGKVKLTNSRVRDVLSAADVKSRPQLCFVAKKDGARPCYHPDLARMIARSYERDHGLFQKAHAGETVSLSE